MRTRVGLRLSSEFLVPGSTLTVRIEIPCVALKNTLDVTSAVQDTDNFDRVPQSMIENDVAAKGKTLHPGANSSRRRPEPAGAPALEAFRKVCR